MRKTDTVAASDAAALRERILDAAAACYLQYGPSQTLHRAIAERAGVSRPTVYKHIGDRGAIAIALLHRELETFNAAVQTVIGSVDGLRERFVETLVFTVQYARQHALFQRLLRQDPQVVLPWLTTEAPPLLQRGIDLLQPFVAEAIEAGEIRKVQPDVVAEWVGRLAISLVLTPSIAMPLDDPDQLRAFVDELFTVGLTATR